MAVIQFVALSRPRGAYENRVQDPINKQIRCSSFIAACMLCVCSSSPITCTDCAHQSRKLATSVAKPLLLTLSRAQLRCFPQPGRNTTMPAALAMAMRGSAPTHVRCESYRSIARGDHNFGRANVKLPGLARAACTVAEGSKLPEADLSYFDKEGNVHTVKVSELTRAKKVVLFAVPGAFTPTCSTQHVPGFVAKAEELRKAGVDVLACVSVNDAFVMRAWGEHMKVGESVLLLSDGLGKFTKALGATVDLSNKPVGLGMRSRRYAMVVDDGVVKALNMEDGGAFTHSSADDILNCLQKHKAKQANVESCSAGHNVM